MAVAICSSCRCRCGTDVVNVTAVAAVGGVGRGGGDGVTPTTVITVFDNSHRIGSNYGYNSDNNTVRRSPLTWLIIIITHYHYYCHYSDNESINSHEQQQKWPNKPS